MNIADAILAALPQEVARWRPATVITTPGGGKVGVRFAGDTITKDIPYLASYTPTVADVVQVLQCGTNQYLVLGRTA